MHDVGLNFAGDAHEMTQRRRVAEVRIATNETSTHAKTQIALNAGQRTFDMLAARLRVEIEANIMPARHLFSCKVDDMAKQTAERRAKYMKDAQFAMWRLAPRDHVSDSRQLVRVFQ